MVDDTYNANPDSVRAAIDVLAELPAPRLLVLGDMGEVGTQGPEFHQEVGVHALKMGIDHVLCLGDLAAHRYRLRCERTTHGRHRQLEPARVATAIANGQRVGQRLTVHEDGTCD